MYVGTTIHKRELYTQSSPGVAHPEFSGRHQFLFKDVRKKYRVNCVVRASKSIPTLLDQDCGTPYSR